MDRCPHPVLNARECATKLFQLQEDEMTKRFFMFVAAILCVAAPAVAQQTESFAGQWQAVFTTPRVVSSSPPTWFILAQGSGEASPTAHFTITIPHTVNLLTLHLAGNWFITPDGNNGHEVIMIDLDEQCRFTGQTTAVCEGTGTISSGTGTYANSTGSISIHVDVDLAAQTAVGRFTGAITR